MRSVENAETFAAYFASDPGALNVCNGDSTSSDVASTSRSPMARDGGANNPAEVPRPTDGGRVGVPKAVRGHSDIHLHRVILRRHSAAFISDMRGAQ